MQESLFFDGGFPPKARADPPSSHLSRGALHESCAAGLIHEAGKARSSPADEGGQLVRRAIGEGLLFWNRNAA